jgi:hypothetical protein
MTFLNLPCDFKIPVPQGCVRELFLWNWPFQAFERMPLATKAPVDPCVMVFRPCAILLNKSEPSMVAL